MKHRTRTAIACVCLMAWAAASVAQHQGHQMGTGSAGGGPCLAHAKEGLRIVENANRQLEEARQTNSPREMRAAMNQLQAALGEIRTQLSLCVSQASESVAPGMGGMDHSSMEGMDHSSMEGMDHSGMGKIGGTAPIGKPVDPVCGMEVDAASAPKAMLDGKTYYFCSEADKAKFLKSPSTYQNH